MLENNEELNYYKTLRINKKIHIGRFYNVTNFFKKYDINVSISFLIKVMENMIDGNQYLFSYKDFENELKRKNIDYDVTYLQIFWLTRVFNNVPFLVDPNIPDITMETAKFIISKRMKNRKNHII